MVENKPSMTLKAYRKAQHKFEMRKSPVDGQWRAWMLQDYATLGFWSAEEQTEYAKATNGYIPLAWVCVAVDKSRRQCLKQAFEALPQASAAGVA